MESLPGISCVLELVTWSWDCPFITITFAIYMKMWTRYFRIVGISVWRTSKIESYKNDTVSGTILMFSFQQINLTVAYI
ncbi:MAG: hypothetical protein A2Z29_09570 [Chloroflexi bacterium RBG_16_56_11]|nr:MAG: hypothetical protein A2Z29_09570 [Chloroflexi bacterium RBG_16_56_11]